MVYGKEYDFPTVVAIKNDIGSVAEVDGPFVEFGRKIVDRVADFRVCAEHLHRLADRLNRTEGSLRVFGDEKVVETFNAAECIRRPS